MMDIKHLMARDVDEEGLSATHMALVVSLLVLVLLGVILVGALMFLRNIRHTRKQAEMNAQLPLYEKRQSSHNRLTITAMPFKGRDSVVVYSEKEQLMRSGPPSPSSPVPEIRITFPDEVDDAGKRQSGRVVVVRVGDHSVGLEPVQEDLPPYQRDASDRFDSLDLDRIGGLKEKDSKYYS